MAVKQGFCAPEYYPNNRKFHNAPSSSLLFSHKVYLLSLHNAAPCLWNQVPDSQLIVFRQDSKKW